MKDLVKNDDLGTFAFRIYNGRGEFQLENIDVEYSGKEGDKNRKIIITNNENKLAQSLMKCLLTLRGENKVYFDYGSLLADRVGRKLESNIEEVLSADILSVLDYYMSLQKEQLLVQNLTDRETFAEYDYIKVYREAVDSLMIDVVVVTVAGTRVRLFFGI